MLGKTAFFCCRIFVFEICCWNLLYFFEVCFWFYVPVSNAPLCMTLPIAVTLKRASCWLQPKLTWMQQTSEHLCSKYAVDVVLYWVCENLLLIFCSSVQRAALHWAAFCGHVEVCRLLIATKADVNARNKCARCCLKFVTDFVLCCVFEDWFWFSALEANAPLCISLPIMVTFKRASCWLQPKLTWMQRTSAHLFFEFATDFVLYFVF